jgi:hypothetical protein
LQIDGVEAVRLVVFNTQTRLFGPTRSFPYPCREQTILGSQKVDLALRGPTSDGKSTHSRRRHRPPRQARRARFHCLFRITLAGLPTATE